MHSKKTAILKTLPLVVLILAGAIFACEQTITLSDENISVVTPDGWERGVPKDGYSLLLGKMEPNGKFRANMSLMITHIPALANQTIPLQDLFNSVKSNLDKTFQADYANLTPGKMVVLGQEILTTSYDILRGGTPMACKQYYIFREGYRYLFTAIATKDNSPILERDFDAIVQSLRFIRHPDF